MSENRRVSLPVLTVGPSRLLSDRKCLSPNSFRRVNAVSPLQSPCASPVSPTRRSLPHTPPKRSLPSTPRTLSPRPHPLPDLDEYFPTSPSSSSSSEQSPRRKPLRKLSPLSAQRVAMRDSGFADSVFNSSREEDEGSPRLAQRRHRSSCGQQRRGCFTERGGEGASRLRSFDYRHGVLIDKGFQNIATATQIRPSRDARRATCPEIWLVPAAAKPVRKVVLRIYGNRTAGKKTLAHQIHHHAKTTAQEGMDIVSNIDDDASRHISFLLNGEEIHLEIVQESQLESSFDCLTVYMVVYNVDKRESFNRAAQLLYRIYQNRKGDVPVLLVGNKIDLKRNKVVTTIEGRMLAKIYHCSFVEVSALMGMNLDEMWSSLLSKLRPVDPIDNRGLIHRLWTRGRSIARSCEEIVRSIVA